MQIIHVIPASLAVISQMLGNSQCSKFIKPQARPGNMCVCSLAQCRRWVFMARKIKIQKRYFALGKGSHHQRLCSLSKHIGTSDHCSIVYIISNVPDIVSFAIVFFFFPFDKINANILYCLMRTALPRFFSMYTNFCSVQFSFLLQPFSLFFSPLLCPHCYKTLTAGHSVHTFSYGKFVLICFISQ